MARFVVPSLSEPKTTYDVDTEARHCTCPAFKHSRNKRWCKHLTFVTTRPDMYEHDGDPPSAEKTLSEALPGLFTIGHSNHMLHDFLGLLERYHVRILIDVRSSPYSRFCPHFAREKLRQSVRAEGMDYFWTGKELGGLGKIPVTSAAFLGRMRQVEEMASRERVVLMCSEGKPKDCHRAYKLSAWMHRHTGMVAQHILRDGTALDSLLFETEMGEKWLIKDYGGNTE